MTGKLELCSNCSMKAESNRDGLTSARCCDYSYMCSWWWVELPPETCRASSLQKYNKLYIVASCWTIIDLTSEEFVSADLKLEIFASSLKIGYYSLLECDAMQYCRYVPVLWGRLLPSPAIRLVAGSSETVVAIYQTAWRHTSEDQIPYTDCCVNIGSPLKLNMFGWKIEMWPFT
jgi:hypothetical protein